MGKRFPEFVSIVENSVDPKQHLHAPCVVSTFIPNVGSITSWILQIDTNIKLELMKITNYCSDEAKEKPHSILVLP